MTIDPMPPPAPIAKADVRPPAGWCDTGVPVLQAVATHTEGREGSRWTCASPKTGQRHRINNSGADAQALDSDFQPSLSESDCTALGVVA
ncbi:hypothetical protein [Ralstonia pseudosolanacearum]|uniref:hypothetical protein n=2 Tax=Ralstonia pseudosolanacearum TaxID=1310165 RepID=UPI0018D16A9A|nr:hypothetical protein [Ralstonia pseudosolanacearum]